MRTNQYCHTQSADMSRIARNCLAALVLSVTLFTTNIDADPLSQCEDVKNAYVQMGFSILDVPVNAVDLKGDDLEICPAGFSCCTRDMEVQLASHSSEKYEDRVLKATNPSRRNLVTATSEIHSFFTQQIVKSEKGTDEMFTRAYDVQYLQNKEVFEEFFSNLKKYYNGADLDVSQIVHQFFRDVFVKMFALQHANYNFTEPYLGCVRDKMATIKPFGDTPELLQRNLKQALVASRTYVQGLAVGGNVITTVQKLQPTASCTKANMKMNFCSHCRGLPSLRPCPNYCLNVMKGCLAYHSELNEPWQHYIEAMEALSTRLSGDGSFNLESVLNPLKDQLSLAVMEYQQSREEVLLKVFDSKTGCGTPIDSPERTKRSYPMLQSAIPFRSRTSIGLRTLVDGVKATLRDVEHLWKPNNLAGSICSPISATTGQKCWNGESDAEYKHSLVGDGLQANSLNPEVDVDAERNHPVIVKQISQLTQITKMIINATAGGDHVTWVELQIPLPNASVATVPEGRSVKSDGNSQPFKLNFRLPLNLIEHGSGSGVSPDDEDYGSGKSPGGRIWFPELINGGSGSGDTPTNTFGGNNINIRPGEGEVNIPFRPDVITPPHQPDEEKTVVYQETTKKPARITAAPPSSSNMITNSASIMAASILCVLCINYGRVL